MLRFRFGSHQNKVPPGVLRGDLYRSVLERDFPEVMGTIKSLWGRPELNLYFCKLAADDRSQRIGFPPEAWDEIQMLASLHLAIVPDDSPLHGP